MGASAIREGATTAATPRAGTTSSGELSGICSIFQSLYSKGGSHGTTHSRVAEEPAAPPARARSPLSDREIGGADRAHQGRDSRLVQLPRVLLQALPRRPREVFP